MSPPAMPSPARTVSRSVAHLHRQGYSHDQARKIIMDVVQAMGSDGRDWEPWCLAWLRGLWKAASTYTAPGTSRAGSTRRDSNG